MVTTEERELPLMRVAEVAKEIGQGQRVVRKAIELGQIPSVRVGRKVLVPRTALRRFLDGQG